MTTLPMQQGAPAGGKMPQQPQQVGQRATANPFALSAAGGLPGGATPGGSPSNDFMDRRSQSGGISAGGIMDKAPSMFPVARGYGGGPSLGLSEAMQYGGRGAAGSPGGMPANDFMERLPAGYQGFLGPKSAATTPPGGGPTLDMTRGPSGAYSMTPPRGPGGPDPFSRPTSAMDVYRSSVPVMRDAMTTAVGGAMADAGFSGNRFGSYAMDRAAQEGSRAGLAQNQLMTGLLHDQTNRDLDRSLQASGMGMQHGQAENQMQLDRMRLLADLGMFEQGRQDQFGRMAYDDFERNKMGFLPLLMSLAQSPGTATQPTWGQHQTGGGPGVMDYAAVIAPIIAAFASDERLKDDIEDFDPVGAVKRLRPRRWVWKDSRRPDAGFVAQEVQGVAPHLVVPIDEAGHLGVSLTEMLALIVGAVQGLIARVETLEAA